MKSFLIIFNLFLSLGISQTKDLTQNGLPVKDFVVHLDNSTIVELSSIKLLNGDSLLSYVKYQPNYASFYEIVEWSCGSPCKQAVIIDLSDGKIIGSLNYCYNISFNDSSTIIIVDDFANNSECEKQLFTIEKEVLKQLN